MCQWVTVADGLSALKGNIQRSTGGERVRLCVLVELPLHYNLKSVLYHSSFEHSDY